MFQFPVCQVQILFPPPRRAPPQSGRRRGPRSRSRTPPPPPLHTPGRGLHLQMLEIAEPNLSVQSYDPINFLQNIMSIYFGGKKWCTHTKNILEVSVIKMFSQAQIGYCLSGVTLHSLYLP